MKFRYGDKIKRIGHDCNTLVKQGEIYTFKDYDFDGRHLHIMEDRTSFGYSIDLFIRVEGKPITNDIEWLDRIQLNFKE